MASTTWSNTSGGDWFASSNWDNGIPIVGEDANIDAAGAYVVTISNSAVANSLTFNASRSELLEVGAATLNTSLLWLTSGLIVLNNANTLGSVIIAGGLLEFGAAGALGAGSVALSAGELLATASETLANNVTFQPGASTIAAAHGATLTLNGANTVANGATVNFGAIGQDGAIVWNGATAIPSYIVHVRAGALKSGHVNFGGLLANDAQTTVDAGATLDVAGFATTINDLQGGGAIVDSGGADTLTLSGAPTNPVFSGVISGAQSVIVSGFSYFTGANTYTGSTEVKAGGGLSLGNFGATGSIAAGGAIVLDSNGYLFIARSNAVTLANAISGAGVLEQTGTGVTTINTANNAFTGFTVIVGGTLAIGNSAALGTTGFLFLAGGEFLSTTTETFGNTIVFNTTDETADVAAAHGTTLTLSGGFGFNADDTIDIGAAGQDGDVVWSPSSSSLNSGDSLDVMDGTLTAGSNALSATTVGLAATIVEAGATLDWAGQAANLNGLQGSGTVTNSGAGDTLFLEGGVNFAGTISGAMALDLQGDGQLSGTETYRGPTTLHGVTTLAIAGTFDDANNNDFFGDPSSSIVNSGLFEKAGASGRSFVNASFVNNGTIDVLSGSVTFDDGFVNHGVIHGLVTHNGGVTTISAPVRSDFSGDSASDILWHSAGGDTLLWNSNGSGGFTGQDIGVVNGYQIAGVGDFNGDGRADILWNATNGDTQLWKSNGSGGFVGQSLGIVAGYKVAGLGDFNGDGEADILWRNNGGDALLWNSNGSGGFTGQDLGVVAGYQVAGVGDFNGDGEADILWNAANGDTQLWKSNGSGGFVGQSLGVVNGYKVAGVGDFNGDGEADILWNAANGDTQLWKSNGSGGFKGQGLGVVDNSYQVASLGDFNGDGKADILWRSASGDALFWNSNGSGGFVGHDLGVVDNSYKITPT